MRPALTFIVHASAGSVRPALTFIILASAGSLILAIWRYAHKSRTGTEIPRRSLVLGYVTCSILLAIGAALLIIYIINI